MSDDHSDHTVSEAAVSEGAVSEGAVSEGAVSELVEMLAEQIVATDVDVVNAARDHHLTLTKPPGSLGQLEDLGVQLAAIAGSAVPPLAEPSAVGVFAGDHGVHAEGVSPWPQEVTAQMVQNFCSGGAAINVISRTNESTVRVINAGVATELADHALLTNTPIAKGTRNLRVQAAMTVSEAASAIMLGADTAQSMFDNGARCLITGDMGIANTTPSAALIAWLTGQDAAATTGRGTGIDDETLDLKTTVVEDALDRVRQSELRADDGLGALAQLGGFEIAAIAGFCLGGAALRLPVIVDGVISLAGALCAFKIAPAVRGYLIGGHRSVEPGASAALEHLDLKPLIDLSLRLGEGSGAALAYPLVRSAARIMTEMATFESAGIGESE